MHRWSLRTAAMALAVILGVGCSAMKPERPKPRPKATPVEPGHAGLPGHLHDASTSALTPEQARLVVAKIGDVELTLGEIERRLRKMPIYVRVRYGSFEKKKELLDDLVRFELLALEAQRLGYTKDPDVVFAMKQAMVKKLMQNELGRLVSMSDISDEEVRRYYREHPDEFHKPAQVRIVQIVLDDEATARTLRSQLARRFEEQPRRKRQIFTEAVQQHSVDAQTRRTNGDTGFFGPDGHTQAGDLVLPKPVVDAAFALEQLNTLSDVVFDGSHYRIFMVTNRRPAVDKPFAQVERHIRNKLFRERKDAARQAYVARLREQAGVEIHEEYLSLIPAPQAEPPRLPGEQQGDPPGLEHIERARRAAERKMLGPDPGEQP